ncbi:hypothetical protein [Pseudotabrizicola sp. 4114]|uniref:hypothetical protein n=1 Tax=Pseudotabrizicola sp. 4114 TaxID=2817731 RepID=UPI00285B4E84|nr:hypothetical protein [Pseudorhodobacter sp. 4114]
MSVHQSLAETMMPQSPPSDEKLSKAFLADLWLLHCQSLQAEIERQQDEIADLKLQLKEALPQKAVASGNTFDGWKAIIARPEPMDPLVQRSFLAICAAMLTTQPEATLQQLKGDRALSKALDSALVACGDAAVVGLITRTMEWAKIKATHTI